MSPSRSGRRRFRFLFWPWGTGFSLVELLVGFALLSAVFLVGSRFFSKISVGVTRSRSGTTAAQLTERTLAEIARDPAYSSAIGIMMYGFNQERAGTPSQGGWSSKGSAVGGKIGDSFKKIFKSFIP
jgi:Tfp pilus assembly protein FimT